MSERPSDNAIGGGRGEAEPSLAIASLGFPIVFLTLLGHGMTIFCVRQGIWVPRPGAEAVWTAIVVAGVAIGVVLSFWRDGGLRKN